MKFCTCSFCQQETITLTKVTTVVEYPTSRPTQITSFMLCAECAHDKYRRQKK